jgi:hypothetical protein
MKTNLLLAAMVCLAACSKDQDNKIATHNGARMPATMENIIGKWTLSEEAYTADNPKGLIDTIKMEKVDSLVWYQFNTDTSCLASSLTGTCSFQYRYVNKDTILRIYQVGEGYFDFNIEMYEKGLYLSNYNVTPTYLQHYIRK